MRGLGPFYVWLVLSFFVCGCGGSGSGDGGVGAGAGGVEDATGSVAFFVRDMPLDGITALWVTIERAELLGDDRRVVIFEGERRVNLLDFKDHEFLLSFKNDVPVGTYEKIRLEVRDPDVAPNPDDLPVTINGNGKLDLNPRGSFEIRARSLVTIHLDVDVPRSVHVHQTGNGRIKVRPVIFVRVEHDRVEPLGLADLTGEIIDVDSDDERFEIRLDDGAGDIEARVQVDSTLFDLDLELASFDDFTVGDRVFLRGELTSSSEIEIEVLLQGDPLRVRGEVIEGGAPFDLELDDGEALSGTIETDLVSGALAYIENGPRLDDVELAAGSRARFTGRYFVTPGQFLVGLVDLECRRVVGTIESLQLDDEPATFFVSVDGDSTEVVLTSTTDLRLVGDGPVPREFLAEDLEVECKLTPRSSGGWEASEVLVTPLRTAGTVTEIDDDDQRLTVDVDDVERDLTLRPDATILLLTETSTSTIELSDVLIGDEIEAFGLEDASGELQVWVLIVER